MTNYLERGLTWVSGIVTIFQFLVSVVNKPSNIDTYKIIEEGSDKISNISMSLQDFSAPGKFIIFLFLEVANAYFFAHLFKKIMQSNNSIPAKVFFYIMVISSTVFISVIFLNTVIFTEEKSLPIFSLFFAISMIITIIFFFCEKYYEKGQQANNFIDRYLTRIGNLLQQNSLWFLMATYFGFWILYAYEMYKK